MSIEKYKALAIFSYGNRSQEDKELSEFRPAIHNNPIASEQIRASLEYSKSPFSFDNELIANSPFTRKLSLMGQFVEGDNNPYISNRNSHSIHVAKVAAKFCHLAGMDSDSVNLTKAIALAHDIGHVPFSHTGEKVFNEKLKPYGLKWDHDDFGIKILSEYANYGLSYKGLPLTASVYEGVCKRYKLHINEPQTTSHYFNDLKNINKNLIEIEKKHKCLNLEGKWNHAEGQTAATFDWICFTVTDIRDFLMMSLNNVLSRVSVALPSERRAEMKEAFEKVEEIFEPAKVILGTLYEENLKEKKQRYPSRETKGFSASMESIIYSFSTKLENLLITDVLDNALKIYESNKDIIKNAEDIRNLNHLVISPSDEMIQHLNALNDHFVEHIYPKITEKTVDVKKLFCRFFDIVKDSFENPGEDKLEISASWRDVYNSLTGNNRHNKEILPIPKEKMGEVTLLVAEYIGLNFDEASVFRLVKKHDPEFFRKIWTNNNLARPRQPHPDGKISWKKVNEIIASRIDNSEPAREK